MNNQKEKSTRRIMLTFFAVILASVVLGFLLGTLMTMVDPHTVAELGSRWIPVLGTALPVMFVGLNVVLLALSVVYYRQGKSLADRIDEDEENSYAAENRLNYALLFSGMAMILNMFLFSASAELSLNDLLSYGQQTCVLLVGLAMILLGIVWICIIQNACVKVVRRMNPEKKGSVFEFNFRKKWEDSSDEWQKQIMYQAGYKAYVTATKLCLGLWVVAIVAQMILQTGVLPSLFVCLIYLVLMVSYTLECMKLEKHS